MATFNSPRDSIVSSNMELIFDHTITSTTSSVNTGTLPVGGYKAYRVYTELRLSGLYWTGATFVSMNGSATSGASIPYANCWSRLRTDNVLQALAGGLNYVNNKTAGPLANAAYNLSNQFGFSVFDIQEPESTDRYKIWTGKSYGPGYFNTDPTHELNAIWVYSNVYQSTQPITTIQFTNTNMVADSKFKIYGIK